MPFPVAGGNIAKLAYDKAENADNKVDTFQKQIDKIVVEGATDPLTRQALVDAEGTEYNTLKERLDKKETETATLLAQNTQDISERVILQKKVQGGQVPSPFRVPTLAVEHMFPIQRAPYTPLWVENGGDTIYARGTDLTFRKSTDGGRTFTKLGYNSFGYSSANGFLKLQTGTLIAFYVSGIIRSIDDGVTWTNPFKFRSGIVPLGSQSWDIDDNTGYIYFGEYNNATQTEINIYISKDDGLTWEVFKSIPTANTQPTQQISHVHAVQYDHVAQRMMFCFGDGSDWTGLWRVTADGLDIEKVITNDMLTAPGSIDTPRCIGIIPFQDYLVWAGDTTQNPYVFRMARSEIGKSNPIVEKMYRLNSTAWFTCRASNDGKTWIITASEEGNSIDNLVHVYAITDNAETIWEVGTLTAPVGTSAGSLMPLGRPNIHGENLWMSGRFVGGVWKFRLGQGFGMIPKPEPLPLYKVVESRNTHGSVTLAPGEEFVFAYTASPVYARRMYVLEASNVVTDNGGVSLGYVKLFVREQGMTESLSYAASSSRYSGRVEHGNEIDTHLFPYGKLIEFVIKNTHSAATISVSASITFAWGDI